MKPLNDIVRFIKRASIGTKGAVDGDVLRRMRAAYDDSSGGRVTEHMGRRVARLALAAGVLIAAGAMMSYVAQLAGGNVAWADVTRRFQAVPFFSVTIYMKDNATAEPMQMELWMRQDGRIRLRKGTQVVFAHGSWMQAYDVKSHQVVELDGMAKTFIEKIGQAQEFSLEAIIEVMFGGRATDVTPLINPDAVISQDVVVFDVTLPDTPEWVRIWALRESRLPVRITVWDPRDGGSTDAIFMYSREQPPEFFDAGAFEGLLQSGAAASGVNVVYAFLRDPGGRSITPEEMFEESGYHVPQVEQAGITPDGAVWIIAAKGQNRMPSGYTFFGFRKLQDDLGREYRQAYAAHRAVADQSAEVFVPADYPFDGRVPGKLILVCEVDNRDPRDKQEIIGTVELTDWARNALWPEGTIDSSESQIMLQAAFHYCQDEEFDKCRRIIDRVSTGPQGPGLEHTVNSLRLRILMRQRQYDEAAAFALELWPVEMQKYLRDAEWPNLYQFIDIVVAIAAAGRIEESHDLWQQVKAAKPDLPGWQKRHADRFYEGLPEAIRQAESEIITNLARIKRPADEISKVIGSDVFADEDYSSLIANEKSQESRTAMRQAAEQRLSELSEYYESHPLPERAQLLERPDGRDVYFVSIGNELPGHPGYKILPINYAVSGVVSNLRVIGADRSDARKVHPYKAAIRFADGAQDRELRADLVYRSGMELADCFRLVLAGCGVELTTETSPARRVLVARYDGRKLRPNTEVYGPWHTDDADGGTRSWRAADLLESLSQQGGAGAYVVDETGLDAPLCLGDGTPQWQGGQGTEQARRWLQEQFGITLVEETRSITTYLVQRRTQ